MGALLACALLAGPRAADAQEMTRAERHPEEHEIVAGGFQVRLGHVFGDNAAWDLGGAVELGAVLDLRYHSRTHWHIRLVLFGALNSDRSTFNQRLEPWRVGARLFPLAVGFGSDLVNLRAGIELALTYMSRRESAPFPGPFPSPPPEPEYDPAQPEAFVAPNLEVAFEVREGMEVTIYGLVPVHPIPYGEYGVSFAMLFF